MSSLISHVGQMGLGSLVSEPARLEAASKAANEELEALVESREVFERAAGELLEGEVLHHEDYDEGFRADDPVELEVVLDRARAAGGALDAFCERIAEEAGVALS